MLQYSKILFRKNLLKWNLISFYKSYNTMEVTRDNFVAAFALLQTAIKDADFIAIDGEFTGLSTLKGRRVSYDTMEEKFDKLKRGSSQFLLIQYGISLFTWSTEKECYEALPFTFYLYPRPYKRVYNDVMFMCQSSSLDFLANNEFDFNKLFHKGISFLSPWNEKKVKERLEKDLSFCVANHSVDRENDSSPKKVFVPKNQRDFIDKILLSIKNFLADDDTKTIDLPSCSPFQRKLIYEILEHEYPLGLYLESVENKSTNEKFIRAIKVTASGLTEIKNENYRKEVEQFEEILGFSKVMKLLAEVKKPIIGHNMLMDIFLTVFNFFDNTITNYKDFKILFHSIFPVIFDTKVMVSNEPLASAVGGTSLCKLYGCVTNGDLPDPLVVQLNPLDNDDEKTTDKFHQAGYDAFCTGTVFISAAKCLLQSLDIQCKRIDLQSNIMSPFVNRVNIFSIRDIFYTDMSRDDIIPCRKNVFYLQFPKGWGERDFDNLFSPICSLSRPTVWLNDTSVYVTISNGGKYDEVYERLISNQRSTDSFYVLPYHEYNPIKQPHAIVKIDDPISQVVKRKIGITDIEDGEISSEDDSDAVILSKKKKISGLFEETNDW